MNSKRKPEPFQNFKTENALIKDAQIGQAGRDLIQAENLYLKIVVRFFRLLSEQALKGSVIGVVIGLCLMVISHKIHDVFKFGVDYTNPARYAEMISAIFVGIYCALFCGRLMNRTSKKVFLAVLVFLVTLWALPVIRSVFIPMLEGILGKNKINEVDTVSYPISYAIICVLTGGVIEIIAEMSSKNQRKQRSRKHSS